MRSTPSSACSARAAIATLLNRQKPIARPASAWWPGGRTAARPERRRPLATCRARSIAPPAASRATSRLSRET